MERYRLILTAKHAYQDVVLSDITKKVTIGTTVRATVRFREEDFPKPFTFTVGWEKTNWVIRCCGEVGILDQNNQLHLQWTLNEEDEVHVVFGMSRAVILKVYFRADYGSGRKKYDKVISLENMKELKIGSSSNCQVQLPRSSSVRGTLSILQQGGNYILQSSGMNSGIYLNRQRFQGSAQLGYLDFFSIGEVSFCFKDGHVYTDSDNGLTYAGISAADEKESLSNHVYPKFNRSTRIEKVIPEEPIRILDPPAEPQKPQGNIIMQLLPAVLTLVVVVLVRGNMDQGNSSFILLSVCTMAVGILTSVMSIFSERKKYRESVKQRKETYESYISEKEKYIENSRREEAEILEDTYYSIPRELAIVDEFAPNLFERRVGEKDFLEVRLGTGNRKAEREVDYRQQETVEALDELQRIPEKVAEKYEMLQDVPVTLKLNDYSLIGVTGARDSLYNVLKILTVDLAVRHYYGDVKFVYSIDEKDRSKFKWLCMLPHVQNDVLNRRNLICDEESRNALMEYLYKELSGRKKDSVSPRLVVFVYREQGIQTHPLSELMYEAKEKGITFIFFSEFPEQLPGGCEQVIRMEDLLHGTKINSKNGMQEEKFVLPVLENRAVSHVARRLAPVYCEEVRLGSTLTKNISLFELLGIYKPGDLDLMNNWLNSKVYQSLAVPVGVKANHQVIYLDLNEKAHGPHGLVAGTTGSGKSEILQTIILSMAVQFHPYEVGFVLIDFKGGGMANQFRDLPHLVGAITNIDGDDVDDRVITRSLLSIRAELNKREKILKEYEVNHIDEYIQLYRKGKAGEALPHLILIVDEFAELKSEYPEFMKELVSTARKGRSLGVHLILATQKPSGVVDPQIWSNSRFKLCLKVQSKEDSNEVLKTPLAVEITEPGRAYLQVGNNEVFELFQSAYSGGSAQVEGLDSKQAFQISKVSMTGKRTVVYEKKPGKEQKNNRSANTDTQLRSIVGYLSAFCQTRNIPRLSYICQPPLEKLIHAEQKEKVRDLSYGIMAAIGRYDAPERQYQGELKLNVTENNTFIVGSARNGKTNALQMVIRSLAEQYSPQEVNMYIFDFGSAILSRYEKLAHVGGVVCANEDEKFKNLMKLLHGEMENRRKVLKKAGLSSYASYLEAGFYKTYHIPQIVVLIDNLTAMRELYLMENDVLLPLCREGNAVGITFVIANSQTSGISYRYLSNFSERIALCCNDSTEYNVLFEGCRMRPYHTPGRGLTEREKSICEVQMYLAFEGEKETERIAHMEAFIAEQNRKWPEYYAKQIPVVPEKLTAQILQEQFRCSAATEQMPVGLDYETVAPVMISWDTQNVLAISGKADLGRNAFTVHMLKQLLEQRAVVYILDNLKGELGVYESQAELYSRNVRDLGEMLEDMKAVLEERYAKIHNEAAPDYDSWPAVVLILNIQEAAAAIAADKTALNAYKEILEKYKNLRSCIIYADLENKAIGFSPVEPLKVFRENKNFLIFDDISNSNLIEKTGAISKKYTKSLEPGEAYWMKDNMLTKVKTISE